MGVLGSVRNMCCGAGWNQRTACLSQEEKGVLIAARGVRTVRRAFLLCTELVFPISNPNCAVFFCYAKSKVFLTLERVYGLMQAIGLIVQMKNIFDKIFQGFFLAVFAAIVVTGLVITLPKYRQAMGLEHMCADLQHRIELKKKEISAVKDKQLRFRTDREFVEGLARENRRAFPGELVFTFDN